jgi:hypothetical protein
MSLPSTPPVGRRGMIGEGDTTTTTTMTMQGHNNNDNNKAPQTGKTMSADTIKP